MLAPLFLMLPTAYHVDPTNGNDTARGTSPKAAWRTFAPVAKVRFESGDRLLLAGGTKIAGPLRLDGASGVTVTSYGRGQATIDGGAGDGISVEGGEGVRIENLTLAAAGRKANDGRGLALWRTKNAQVRSVDVSGFRVGGVEVIGSTGTRLEKIHAHDNGAAGISVSGGFGDFPRSSNVTVRDCRAMDNPGDPKNLTNHSGNGIVVGGIDGCLIEFCEAANNGWDMPREGNGPVGIWAWNASRVTIQDCISHENKSPGTDGGGFDLDGGVTDSILQRNLSFGNAGAGYLLCQYQGAPPWGRNTVRNNVSYEDGQKNFFSGIALFVQPGMAEMKDAVVERNTIVNSRYAAATMGDVPGVVYRNNVFVSGPEMLNVAYGEGGFRNATFKGNLAWSPSKTRSFLGKDSPFASPEAWRATGGLFADPRLKMPASIAELPTDPRQLATTRWFRPLAGSPCVVAGKTVYGALAPRP